MREMKEKYMKTVKKLIPKMVRDSINTAANKDATKRKNLVRGQNKAKDSTSAAQTQVIRELEQTFGIPQAPKMPIFYIGGHP